jgi:hypothetical protein
MTLLLYALKIPNPQIKQIVAIGPANYPEVTCGVFGVNCPMITTMAWKLVRPLLPKDTAEKVRG